jgi:hypothetical protein
MTMTNPLKRSIDSSRFVPMGLDADLTFTAVLVVWVNMIDADFIGKIASHGRRMMILYNM